MVRLGRTQQKLVSILSDGLPKTTRDLVNETRLSQKAVEHGVTRLWKRGIILRTEEPIREHNEVFKGRAGLSHHLRSYHFYVFSSGRKDSIKIKGKKFL